MSFSKILSQTTILIAVAAVIYIVATLGINYKASSAVKLEMNWRTDIKSLKHAQKLPAYWSDLKIAEKICGPEDKTALQWLKSVSAPIEINPNGNYKLEILFISDNDNGNKRAVIRHHIIHLPTGNSVWELSRTYDLN